MRNATIFVATFILFIASSCSTYTKTTGAAQLKGHYWKLVEVNGKSLTDAQLAREPFIIFSDLDSRVSGNSSCNHFFGNYTLGADSQVTISQIGATKMACPDMSIEQQLFQLLPKVRSYERNGENLLLKNADGNTSARFLLGEKK
ncbi:MAG: META domain-containing protein [Flavisolibacter sp.]